MTDQGPKPPAQPPPLPDRLKDTPREPYPPAPTVATAQQVSALGQTLYKVLTEHARNVDARLANMHEELALSRASTDTTQPAAPSKARVALNHAIASGQLLLLATGAVGVAMQIAAVFKPSLVSPLQHLQSFLKGLGSP